MGPDLCDWGGKCEGNEGEASFSNIFPTMPSIFMYVWFENGVHIPIEEVRKRERESVCDRGER